MPIGDTNTPILSQVGGISWAFYRVSRNVLRRSTIQRHIRIKVDS